MITPWAHGSVVRATRYPGYFDFNVVRVEDDPATGVDALASFADEALEGLAHRRLDFELVAPADSLRAGFQERGWKAMRLLWMRHQRPLPPGPDVCVEEVPYDAVHDLRVAWHSHDFPDQDARGFVALAREVALARDAQVFALREGGLPVAFAQLEHARAAETPRAPRAAEITLVYVHPEYRGAGAAPLSRALRSTAREPYGICGSSRTTRAGQKSCTRGSAFVRHGLSWSSCRCRRALSRRVGTPRAGASTFVQSSPQHSFMPHTACSTKPTAKGKLVVRRGRKVRDLDEIARPPVDAREGYLVDSPVPPLGSQFANGSRTTA